MCGGGGVWEGVAVHSGEWAGQGNGAALVCNLPVTLLCGADFNYDTIALLTLPSLTSNRVTTNY